MLKLLYCRAAIAIARPYIRRELPGWGRIYRCFIGSHQRDWLWRGEKERWIRGKLHGYQMSVRIAGWSNRATFFLERFYDFPTQLLLQRALNPGDTFVDVGANEGMMTLLASNIVGEQGTVIAFEPNPVPRRILRRNLARNRLINVELHGSGLGDQRSNLQLFVPHVNSGEGSFTPPSSDAAGEFITCPVSIGDDVIGDRRPRVIKIDVEGFEAHVLRGLARTLARDRPILVMEIIARHLARDEQTPQKLCEWLIAFGYVGHRLGLRGRRDLQMIPITPDYEDGDYVFIHREAPALE